MSIENSHKLTPRNIELELIHRKGDLQRARVRAVDSGNSNRVNAIDRELSELEVRLREIQKEIK